MSSVEEIKQFLDLYKQFFLFLFFPQKIWAAIKNKSNLSLFNSIIIFDVIIGIVFYRLLNIMFLNFEKTGILIIIYIFISSIIYFPIVFSTFLFEKKQIKKGIKISSIIIFEIIPFELLITLFIYLLFLFLESYFFYFLTIFLLFGISFYICIYCPIKFLIRKRKIIEIIAIVINLAIYFGINLSIFYPIAKYNTKESEFVFLDLIYEESIRNYQKIVEIEKYFIEKSIFISSYEMKFTYDNNIYYKQKYEEQIDLMLNHESEIDDIIASLHFNYNKRELFTLKEIIKKYKLIKSELNTYEPISDEYEYKLNTYSEELNKLNEKISETCAKEDLLDIRINQFLSNNTLSEKEKNEQLQNINEEINKLTENANTLNTQLSELGDTGEQVRINISAIKEVNKQQNQITLLVQKLQEQQKETEKYWSRRSKFLL